MKSNFFLRLIISLAALFFAYAACAQPIEPAAAKAWAEQKGAQLLTAFRIPDIEKRYQTLDKLFLDHIDVDYVARFVIGKYWKTMSPEQQQNYRQLFERYALGIYKTFPLDFANNLTYTVTGVTSDKAATIVSARVHFSLEGAAPAEDVDLHFRLHRQGGQIRLIDIKLAESSLLLAYRSRFYEMIAANDGDIEWFLEDLADLAYSAEQKNQSKLEKSPDV